jgi:MarR family transcriptional regulator, organic hydroperoxide resistance regulator
MQEKTIDFTVRTTWQAIYRMYNDEASKYEATMSLGFTLLSIDKEGGTKSTTLAPKMGMEPSSLTRTLKTMEEKGLIYREPNPNDGRGVLIFLTELGKEKRAQSKETVIKFNETIRDSIPKDKMANFLEVSEMIMELIADKKIFK